MGVILADIGATNARFCVLQNGHLSEVYQFVCDDFANPYQLIDSFIHLYGKVEDYMLIGAPGAVVKNRVKWTNRKWHLDGTLLKKKLKLKQVVLLNDVEAQGHALPLLTKKDFAFLQKRKLGQGPQILVNIGTGLGACFRIGNSVFATEYGQNIVANGQNIESLVSGPAFKHLYGSISKQKGSVPSVQITERYFKGDRAAQKTYQQFYLEFSKCLMNLALTIKATGGVFIAGGVLNETSLKKMRFTQSFVKHPTMKHLLKEMPLCYIKQRHFAFIGLKALAQEYGWS